MRSATKNVEGLRGLCHTLSTRLSQSVGHSTKYLSYTAKLTSKIKLQLVMIDKAVSILLA